MVFDEKIKTAFDVLRNAATNDFERHRIDVLERDLTAPPVAEQVDNSHQSFNGVIYRKNKDGHYSKQVGIHVDVWRYYNGDIPEGYVIHHDDWNPSNNAPDNLQLVTRAEHKRIHNFGKPVRRRELATVVCLNCGKIFMTDIPSKTKFCSQNCKVFYHNRHHEPVRKTCEYCGKEFILEGLSVMHAKSQRFCSRECAQKSGRDIRVCPCCGERFETTKSNPKRCCSHSCSTKFYYQQKREKSSQPARNDGGGFVFKIDS